MNLNENRTYGVMIFFSRHCIDHKMLMFLQTAFGPISMFFSGHRYANWRVFSLNPFRLSTQYSLFILRPIVYGPFSGMTHVNR